MNIQQNIPERLSRASTTLVLDHPFFGMLKTRMDFAEDARTDTMATDGRKIYYSREFVAGITDDELLGVTAHEVMHAAMLHQSRRAEREPQMWNEACDLAINPILVDSGFALPEGGLNDPQFHGKTAEQIFDVLSRRPKPPTGKDGEGGEGQGGEGSLRKLIGAVLDAQDPAQEEAEWSVALQQAIKAAQMQGALPAALRHAVEQVLKPRVDWKSILRRFVQTCAAADYSWKRPNRRYIQGGIYMPEIRSENMPPIVFVYDSSGSTMSVAEVFAAELQSVVDECRPEAVYVVMADAAVQSVERFERDEPIKIEVRGLGGTDFRPAFQYLDAAQLEPACVIYLTDAYGDYPAQEPDYPVLWAVTTEPDSLRQTPYYPPFGEVVFIEEHAQ